ncbi:hypothetical protein LguiA_012807 [Lonicera macranthoides]
MASLHLSFTNLIKPFSLQLNDINALAKDRAYAQIHLNEMSIQQVIRTNFGFVSPYNFRVLAEVQFVLLVDQNIVRSRLHTFNHLSVLEYWDVEPVKELALEMVLELEPKVAFDFDFPNLQLQVARPSYLHVHKYLLISLNVKHAFQGVPKDWAWKFKMKKARVEKGEEIRRSVCLRRGHTKAGNCDQKAEV